MQRSRTNQEGIYIESFTLGPALAELSRLNNKSQEENLLSFGRTFLTNSARSGLVDIMPPAGHGHFGSAARLQGERAIERDLSRLFVGVQLKGERKEQHPDPAALHLAAFIQKRPGRSLRERRSAKFYVDQRKLRALSVRLKSHVGRLASALLVAAHRLGIASRIPAWIRRHGPGAGECVLQPHGPRKYLEIALYAPENSPVIEIERRMTYALNYTAKRVVRAVTGAVAASARRAGFRAAG